VSEIVWDNKPEWADVWIEDLDTQCGGDYGGWHRETDTKYVDKNGGCWMKTTADVGDIKVHHPPSERERLQNKPSWNEAPEWAEWLAQDSDGEWFWFIDRPVIYKFTFQPVKSPQGIQLASKGEVLGDWRDTLESRPEFITPPTHLNMRCIVKPIERKEWNGQEDGLPPVGIECEYRTGNEWYECEVLAHKKGGIIAWCKTTEVSGLLMSEQVRPLRTEEDKAVEDIVSVMASVANPLIGGTELALALYRAGYRKQEEPK
jgi:hypothetical protein